MYLNFVAFIISLSKFYSSSSFTFLIVILLHLQVSQKIYQFIVSQCRQRKQMLYMVNEGIVNDESHS